MRRIVDEAVALATEIIERDRENISRLADLLIAKETIFGEDIESILGKSAQVRDEKPTAEAAEEVTETAEATEE